MRIDTNQDWKMELYWQLPIFLQEMTLSIYARHLQNLYYGAGYEEWRHRYKYWQTWSRTNAEVWQHQQLRAVVGLAASRVPYYRHQWRNLEWKAIQSTADLHLLPCLEKQAIRQNESAFIVEGINPKTLWMDKTSGTTGTALRIFWPPSMLPRWWAIMEVMVRNVAGASQDMPRAMMGGRPIIRGNTTRPPYWRFNRLWRQLYLSSYHISHNTALNYITALRQHASQWLTGYGSAIAALAESALETGIPPLPLRTVIVSGDTLLPGMRSSIEQYFQCKCFDHYGQSEGVCMAMECRYGRMHVNPFVGILEIVQEDGSPCVPGEVGEMVATGLMNNVMPLIRYRLGDYAAWAEEQSCPCGNSHPIITRLEGRVDDYLITADGRKIGRLSTAVKRSPTIHSAQIVQDRPGHAYLLIRPAKGYQPVDAAVVRDDIIARIGAFDLEVMEVGEIPKTIQGKTVLVVRLTNQPAAIERYKVLLTQKHPYGAVHPGTGT
jgi:phenylacetate-CoA ligase